MLLKTPGKKNARTHKKLLPFVTQFQLHYQLNLKSIIKSKWYFKWKYTERYVRSQLEKENRVNTCL